MKKLSITQVKNGFIVRVINQGLSVMKTEYETPVHVFQNPSEVSGFLSQFFDKLPETQRATASGRDPLGKY